MASNDTPERLAVVEALQQAVSEQHGKMLDRLDELNANAIRTAAAVQRVEEKMADGSSKFNDHDDRIKSLENHRLQFETQKNILLSVAGAFGAFVGAVAALIAEWFRHG